MIIQSNSYQDKFLERKAAATPRKLSQISTSKNSSDINFSGGFFQLSEKTKKNFYTSNAFKKFAKMTSNPVLLEATAVLGLSCLLRPLTIMALPGAEKRDKQYASAHSLISGLWSYGSALLLYSPINKVVNKITEKAGKDPNYLKGSFIHKNGKNKAAFNFVVSTIPKIILHPLLDLGIIALIPTTMKFLFPQKPKNEQLQTNNNAKKPSKIQFKGKLPSGEKPSGFFQKIESKLKSWVEKLAYNKHVQKYSESMANSSKEKSAFLKQVINTGTAFLGTLVYIVATRLNPKIEDDRKNTLSANYAITWGLSAIGTIGLNKSFIASFDKISDNYKKYNSQAIEENFAKKLQSASGEKLAELTKEKAKELEKINLHKSNISKNAASMICFALMYRYITPVIATPLAELSKKLMPQQNQKQKLAKS